MLVISSVSPLLGGGGTTQTTCTVHITYTVSTLNICREATALTNKTTVQKCSQEFSKWRNKLDCETGTMETVGTSHIKLATKQQWVPPTSSWLPNKVALHVSHL
jgi:hypothetical protein